MRRGRVTSRPSPRLLAVHSLDSIRWTAFFVFTLAAAIQAAAQSPQQVARDYVMAALEAHNNDCLQVGGIWMTLSAETPQWRRYDVLAVHELFPGSKPV